MYANASAAVQKYQQISTESTVPNADPYRLVMMLLDEAELVKFRHSEGWRAGIDGSVDFVEWGKTENIDTINIKDPILGFAFGTKGLMANVALEGSKFILLNKE